MILEKEEELGKVYLNLIGLAEITRKENGHNNLKCGNAFSYSSTETGRKMSLTSS